MRLAALLLVLLPSAALAEQALPRCQQAMEIRSVDERKGSIIESGKDNAATTTYEVAVATVSMLPLREGLVSDCALKQSPANVALVYKPGRAFKPGDKVVGNAWPKGGDVFGKLYGVEQFYVAP